MSRKDRLEFDSYDGKATVRTGQGDHCVFVQITGLYAGSIVLNDDEAEALGRGLIRRARYSREVRAGDPNPR